jgi:acyl-CoA reductase-like NAD-dependent aldehyde dehydrogenase
MSERELDGRIALVTGAGSGIGAAAASRRALAGAAVDVAGIDPAAAGRTVGIDRGVVSDPAAPFGGPKRSGLGREGSSDGILEFLETRNLAVTT